MAQNVDKPDFRFEREASASDADMHEPADLVYAEISNAIFEQRLKPGTKLGEQMLGEIFNMNRPIIRRALMRLSYERLVDIRPHRGAFVASPTPEEARQVFEARRVMEEWVIRSCASRSKPDDLNALRQHVKIERDANQDVDRARRIRLSGAFHITLARIAGNDRILKFLEDMIAQTSLIISLYGNNSNSACDDDDHHQIVEAIARKNADGAVKRMLDHLSACEKALDFRDEPDGTDLHAIFKIDQTG